MLIRSQTLRAALGCAAAFLVWAGVSATLAWGTAGAVADLRASGPAPFDSLVAVAAAAAAWACLSWLSLALSVSLLSGLPAHAGGLVARVRDAIAPWAVRRLAGAVLGIAAVSVPVATVGAAPAAAAIAPVRVSSVAGALSAGLPAAISLDRPGIAPELDRPLDGEGGPQAAASRGLPGWTPDRPAAIPRAQPAADSLPLVTSRPHPRHADVETIAVRRGDTLWDIAARSLGPQAGPLDVAREWPRWYVANRAVIGPDPGLLVPGTVLVPPAQAA